MRTLCRILGTMPLLVVIAAGFAGSSVAYDSASRADLSPFWSLFVSALCLLLMVATIVGGIGAVVWLWVLWEGYE